MGSLLTLTRREPTVPPALGQLAVLAGLLTGLIVFESVRFARERDELLHGEQHA
ncbi:hypothetical protein OG558_28050 [Kribbella sp. NBC_01510]|uniref:hypothetical protein n=1 Tax=Kribbella sp. NBC_01510 TaxID=2903581 RepID=UPI00386BB44B